MSVSSQDFKLPKCALLSNGTSVTVKQKVRKEVQLVYHLKVSSYVNAPYSVMVPVSLSSKKYDCPFFPCWLHCAASPPAMTSFAGQAISYRCSNKVTQNLQ